MSDSVQGEGSNGGGSGKLQWRPSVTTTRARSAFTCAARAQAPDRPAPAAGETTAYKHARTAYAHARGYDYALTYAHVRPYVSLGVKGSGLLALLLSTVVLLGGYVQSLLKEDFFCIITITMIQAAGIFQDWETNLQYLSDFGEIFLFLLYKLPLMMMVNDSAKGFLITRICALVVLPLAVLILCVQLFYLLGPLACAGISSWRIAKLNHSSNNRDADMMMAALNIFYSLIIFQGTMFGALFFTVTMGESVLASSLLALEELSEKWGKDAVRRYISDISEKCRKDPLSTKGMDLIKYGAELLDSESKDDYLYGARLLSAFIKKEKDVSWVMLSSKHKIQRLMNSLMRKQLSR